MRILTLFVLGTVMMTASGCVSKSRHNQEVASLQGQIAQMDAALKAQQEKIQTPESQRSQTPASGTFSGATYRTPSGFELPANDIQRALKNAGYYSGGVDGKIGPDSREAIRNFQRDNGLGADGVVGRQTWTKLKTYLDVVK